MSTSVKMTAPMNLAVVTMVGIFGLTQAPSLPTADYDKASAPIFSFAADGLRYGNPPMEVCMPEYPDMCEQSENLKRLEAFSAFKENWNGYGANSFPKTLIDRIRRLLVVLTIQPEIFPTARDSIQLEYDVGDNHIEIEVFSNGDVKVLSMKGIGHFTQDSFSYDEDAIRRVVDRFYASIAV